MRATVSHYRLGRRLGAGGMGEVYLEDDLALGRRAALKILLEGFSPELRAWLFREAEASARLQQRVPALDDHAVAEGEPSSVRIRAFLLRRERL